MKMYRLTLVIAVLSLYFESGSAEICDTTRATACTLAQWKTNVECRINGGAATPFKSSGYLPRFLESEATTPEQQAFRYEGIKSFIQAKEQLGADFDSKTAAEKVFILEQIESKLNEYMPKLPVKTITTGTGTAAKEVEVKWTSTTCLSDEATSVAVPCGWFTATYDPTCAIA